MKKKLISLLTVLAMLSSMFSAAPVFAVGSQPDSMSDRIVPLAPVDYFGSWSADGRAGSYTYNALQECMTLNAEVWAGGYGMTFNSTAELSSLSDITVEVVIPQTAYYSDAINATEGALASGSIMLSTVRPILTTYGYMCKLYSTGSSIDVRIAETDANGSKGLYFYSNNTYIGNVQNPGFSAGDTVTFRFRYSSDGIQLFLGTAATPVYTFPAASSAISGEIYIGAAAASYGASTTGNYTVNKINEATVNDFGYIAPPDISWNTLTPVNADGIANAGTVSLTDGQAVFSVPAGEWWPMAGLTTATKFDTDGLSIVFEQSAFSDASQNGYFGIFLSNTQPTAFSTSMLGRTYSPDLSASNTLAITFFGSTSELSILTEGVSSNSTVNTVSAGSDVTVEFESVGSGIYKVKINDTYLKGTDQQDFTFNLSTVVDDNGQSYLTFAAVGYGSSGGSATVKQLNGNVLYDTSDTAEIDISLGDLSAELLTGAEAGIRFGSRIYKNEKYSQLTSYGILVIDRGYLDDSTNLQITDSGKIYTSLKPEGAAYTAIAATAASSETSEYIDFTASYTGIGTADYDTRYIAVGYAQYSDGSVSYSAGEVASYNGLYYSANGTAASDSISDVYTDVTRSSAKGNGITDDTAAVLTAINSISATGGTLYFPAGTYKVTSITLPENILLNFAPGAKLTTVDTVTVSSKGITAGYYEIFGGSGIYTGFSAVSTVYPQWFGAVASDSRDDSAAIQKAVDAAVNVYFPEGVYNVKYQISFTAPNTNNRHSNLNGAGAQLSVIEIASNITAFSFDAGSLQSSSNLMVEGLGFKGADRTSTAIRYLGTHNAFSWLDVSDCYFYKLNIGVYFNYSGGVHFTDNLSEYNNKAYQVGEQSMFIYWDLCTGNYNNNFIYCNVPPSAGVSNGLMITDCTTYGSTGTDIYVTENQAVYVEGCSLTGGTGGEAAIYFYNSVDVRVSDTVISSAASASSRDGIRLSGDCNRAAYYGNTVSSCRYGFNLNGDASTVTQRYAALIYDNSVSSSSACDIYFGSDINDLKVFRNTCSSALPVSGSSAYAYNILLAQNIFPNTDIYNIAAASNISTGVVGNNTFANGIA